MKLHLLMMLGLDNDLKFLSHWLEHYKKFPFDAVHILLQSNSDNRVNLEKAIQLIRAYGDKYSYEYIRDLVDYTKPGTTAKTVNIQKYYDALEKNDWLFIADADELLDLKPDHFKPLWLKTFEWYHGYFVDRLADKVKAIEPNPSLFEQFPYRDFVMKGATGNAEKFVAVKRTKEGIPVLWEGCHNLKGGKNKYQYACAPLDVEINHFKWHKDSPGNRFYLQNWFTGSVPVANKDCSETEFNPYRLKTGSLHFATLYGVDRDLELLKEWCIFHKKYNFNYYHVYLHSASNDKKLLKQAENILKNQSFTFEVVTGKYSVDMQAMCLRDYKEKHLKSGKDYLVYCDSDEFLEIDNESLLLLRAGNVDGIQGVIIDRVASNRTLKKYSYSKDVSIFEQYPLKVNIYGTFIADDLETKNKKIPISKKFAKISNYASAKAYNGVKLHKAEIFVHHFKWREGLTKANDLDKKWYKDEKYNPGKWLRDANLIPEGVPSGKL